MLCNYGMPPVASWCGDVLCMQSPFSPNREFSLCLSQLPCFNVARGISEFTSFLIVNCPISLSLCVFIAGEPIFCLILILVSRFKESLFVCHYCSLPKVIKKAHEPILSVLLGLLPLSVETFWSFEPEIVVSQAYTR